MEDTIPPAATPAATPPAAAPAVPPAAAPVAPVAIAPVVPATAAPAATAPAAPAAPAGEDANTKALREANDRIARLEATNLDNLRARVAAEKGLPVGAGEFLTATDEAGLNAQADKIKAFAPASAAPAGTPPPAPAAGTVTNPPAPSTQTIDERIAAAEKSGKVGLSIQLKREKAGMRA